MIIIRIIINDDMYRDYSRYNNNNSNEIADVLVIIAIVEVIITRWYSSNYISIKTTLYKISRDIGHKKIRVNICIKKTWDLKTIRYNNPTVSVQTNLYSFSIHSQSLKQYLYDQY